jgi:rRNA-processing protein FCF1
MDRDTLYLVLDTNVFLAPPNPYHDKLTGDSRTAVRILQDFRMGNFGSLPSATVWIPWIVRSELVGLSSRDLSSCWRPDRTTAGQAAAALDYLDSVTLEPDTCIVYQNQLEYEEANLLQTHADDQDEMVLISCFQTKLHYSKNVWLVTNDIRLSARAMRSGIGSLTFSALKHAMTLRNGEGSACGDSFLGAVPVQWRHLANRKPIVTPWQEASPSLRLPSARSSNQPSSLIKRLGFDTKQDLLLWIYDAVYCFCLTFLVNCSFNRK